MSGFDLSDPAITQAVRDVIDDKNEEVEYVILTAQTQPNKIVVESTGKGGIEEIKGLLKADALQFVYYRVIAGDEESRRVKFVLICWAGEGITKPKLRAIMSILKADVKTIITNYAVELHATSVDDLKEDEIMTKIKKAGGADYSANTSSSN